MLGALARKIFGSSNDRRLKTYTPKVAAINALEAEVSKLSDMADPSKNAIASKFGKDVEEVAKVGPPRAPKIPADLIADTVAQKMASVSI